MFEVIVYEDKSGSSSIKDEFKKLLVQSETSKTARIQYKKILSFIGSLKNYGTRAGEPFVKHLEGDLWELRPLSHRIFFFYWKDNTFVLLHHFIKKSQKTPKREIEIAKHNMNDFLERYN